MYKLAKNVHKEKGLLYKKLSILRIFFFFFFFFFLYIIFFIKNFFF